MDQNRKGHLQGKYSIKEAYNEILRTTGNDLLFYYHEQTLSRGIGKRKMQGLGICMDGRIHQQK